MELVRLEGLVLDGRENGNGLSSLNLTFSKGDAFSICTDSPEHAHLLVRGIATLSIPLEGKIYFRNKQVDISSREALLAYKKNIGYVAADATLIKKASAFDNLMLMPYYFEDTIPTEMTESILRLCRLFGLEDKLKSYPWQLEPEENRLFVIIRELAKKPAVLLIERPGDYLRDESLEILKKVLQDWSTNEQALVLFSAHQDFVQALCHKQINILKGQVTTSDLEYCKFHNKR
jgi:ABC-type lipoprotein export system ATPase subunit